MLEANDIVLATPKNIELPKPAAPDHRNHPMGQFLSFIKSEIPNVEGYDDDVEKIYREELHKHIDSLLGDDPSHFTALHTDLTTDDMTGDKQQADLYDVLQRVTRKAGENANRRYSKEIMGRGIDSDDLRDVTTRFREHMDTRAGQLIRGRARNNPKLRMIDSLTDIKI